MGIRLIAFDVDGTLTTGALILGAEGEAYKIFHARDGLAISLAHRMGYLTGVVTGRSSAPVQRRAAELSMNFAVMDAADKVAAMEALRARYGLAWEEIAYMGDDLNDLALMERAGLSGCPADGAEEIRQAADFLSAFPGGRGAARDFVEYILKREGRWEEAVRSFRVRGPAVSQ